MSEIRPGLLVVIVECEDPSFVGTLFTIKSGPHKWRWWHPRVVWVMEEKFSNGDYFCFARHEFKPLPPPDDIIKKAKESSVDNFIDILVFTEEAN
jgi:hypothetical protein